MGAGLWSGLVSALNATARAVFCTETSAMRSVVLKTTERCACCQLPPRWCVCAGMQPIACPLQIDVLTHHRERFRPSSTGNLINRAIPASRYHLWRKERRLERSEVHVPGRELWILQPGGEPVPAGVEPASVQVLLLDGSWREASAMGREVAAWGRPVSLPLTGESRYWLRAQQDGGRFSTAEALLALMSALGLRQAHDDLQVLFELHVYAGLRSRGLKDRALEFLATSPLLTARSELLAQMHIRRPR